MAIQRLVRGLCSLLAALALSIGLAHARYVVLGHVDLSFYEVTAAVVQQVLERLGYNVAVKKGSHSEIYPRLAAGEVDLFVAAWLPNAHAKYWQQYKDDLVRVSRLYDDARLFWAVPDYVPAAEVGAVADLARPGVAAKMEKVIRGTRPDSGLMIGSQRVFEAYRLGEAGYRLAPGDPADWIASFNDNIAARKWFVMPLWQPQFLNKAAKLRILDEPHELLGKKDSAYLVAHKDLRQKLDRRTWETLKRIELSVAAVTDMDYLVNVRKMSPREVARAWIGAHPDTVTYWLEPED
ncbi:MAG TPA: glycine betaine ABC transporter substrate-binding protein [Burkholderiales bacterium]|nr:glycine betaine ABC transporter substrate-binding protein [Burkholderiales bacterium]